MFNKFRFLSGNLRYRTAVPSTATGRIIMAYTEEPNYMEGRGAGSTSDTNRIAWTESDLANLPHEVGSAVWNNYTFKIPFNKARSQQFYYTNSPYGKGLEIFTYGENGQSSDDRQCFQGVVYIGGNTGSLALNAVAGDLYFDYVVEFCDTGNIGSFALPTLSFTPLEYKINAALESISKKKDKRRQAIKEIGELKEDEKYVEVDVPCFETLTAEDVYKYFDTTTVPITSSLEDVQSWFVSLKESGVAIRRKNLI